MGDVQMANRPFYRYGGYIQLISFKEYYGMPRGHELDPIYSFCIGLHLIPSAKLTLTH